MQFKVPQNVRREDKIVGPLTLKQLLICGGGGIVSYAIYVSLARTYIWITWLPPIVIIVVITVAFAFARPLDLSFTKWILRRIEFSLLPKDRYWIKASGEVPPVAGVKAKKTKTKKEKKAEKTAAEEERQQKMEGLQKFLEAEDNKKKK